MSKVIVVPKGEGSMKLGDYNYDSTEETLLVGSGEFGRLNSDEEEGDSVE